MYQSPFAQVQIRLSELAQSPDPCYNLLKCPFLYSMPYYSKGPTLPYVPYACGETVKTYAFGSAIGT